MTELSFLIDLLLNHKLPKTTQQAIKARLDSLQSQPIIPSPPKPAATFSVRSAPSPEPPPVPFEQIAQNPTTQAALAQRQAMIDAAASRKPMPGMTTAPKTHGTL